MPTPDLMLTELNAMDRDAFSAALAGLFEGPPWIVAAAWDARPFASRHALHHALCRVMEAAPEERKVALIRAHPDLVGRAALAGTLTPASTAEQAAAGLDRLSPDEIATFQRLNADYQARFGFPFVICARKNKKVSILAGFAERMAHTREQEIATALAEVAKICWLRLCDAVAETPATHPA
ncbi:MAG TPA: 2-oxo-4-hydroxy-4-carboxy-5-ureidoimidazoline decarboxylase [Ktedonobacterales bacterium]|nr:2-oxo-4-hydroxy-4-carboxy-5-ureidoimidazoline decarboxylase [Ktedonobacterales bacterium]